MKMETSRNKRRENEFKTYKGSEQRTKCVRKIRIQSKTNIKESKEKKREKKNDSE